jgi:hypothetical protein
MLDLLILMHTLLRGLWYNFFPATVEKARNMPELNKIFKILCLIYNDFVESENPACPVSLYGNFCTQETPDKFFSRYHKIPCCCNKKPASLEFAEFLWKIKTFSGAFPTAGKTGQKNGLFWRGRIAF